MEENNHQEKDNLFSKAVQAGQRTYFFDARLSRGKDMYLVITESKKIFSPEGQFQFEKHKIFLYKEDFAKFQLALDEAVDSITSYNEGRDINSAANPEQQDEPGSLPSDHF